MSWHQRKVIAGHEDGLKSEDNLKNEDYLKKYLHLYFCLSLSQIITILISFSVSLFVSVCLFVYMSVCLRLYVTDLQQFWHFHKLCRTRFLDPILLNLKLRYAQTKSGYIFKRHLVQCTWFISQKNLGEKSPKRWWFWWVGGWGGWGEFLKNFRLPI